MGILEATLIFMPFADKQCSITCTLPDAVAAALSATPKNDRVLLSVETVQGRRTSLHSSTQVRTVSRRPAQHRRGRALTPKRWPRSAQKRQKRRQSARRWQRRPPQCAASPASLQSPKNDLRQHSCCLLRKVCVS